MEPNVQLDTAIERALTKDRKYSAALRCRKLLMLITVSFLGSLLFGCILIVNSRYIYSVPCFMWAELNFRWLFYGMSVNSRERKVRKALEQVVGAYTGFTEWKYVHDDVTIKCRTAQTASSYTQYKYFTEHPDELETAIRMVKSRQEYIDAMQQWINSGICKSAKYYPKFVADLNTHLEDCERYRIRVSYISSRTHINKGIYISLCALESMNTNRDAWMPKTILNRINKEQLATKQSDYYNRINSLIDTANEYRETCLLEDDKEQMDANIKRVIASAQGVQKIKSTQTFDWTLPMQVLNETETSIRKIISRNTQLQNYYASPEFEALYTHCATCMDMQREFNEYVDAKLKNLTTYLGTRVCRDATIHTDTVDYLHPYQKEISPFTAELSAQVFASAENNPLQYIVKCFYPDKAQYPVQIQNLQTLLNEMATLREAKAIIDEHKQVVAKHLSDVPPFVMEYEDMLYERLGLVTINEKTLTVAYRFAFTSASGRAQRFFDVPMTEDMIVQIIHALEDKLTMKAFAKEQRNLMTPALRHKIKTRDNFTCCVCGNSTAREPNLLLEIDHIQPVAKGGCTIESNLQTLCWRCNRSKGTKTKPALSQNETSAQMA